MASLFFANRSDRNRPTSCWDSAIVDHHVSAPVIRALASSPVRGVVTRSVVAVLVGIDMIRLLVFGLIQPLRPAISALPMGHAYWPCNLRHDPLLELGEMPKVRFPAFTMVLPKL